MKKFSNNVRKKIKKSNIFNKLFKIYKKKVKINPYKKI